MIELAIVGGGPGGLMNAFHIKKKIGNLAKVTIFEASDRLGGKIVTKTFGKDGPMYEEGVAEIYDYSMIGPDPLRELIEGFQLQTTPMDSDSLCIDNRIVDGVADMRKVYGDRTADAILKFRKLLTQKMTPQQYYEGVGKHDNDHDWAWENCEELLDAHVNDPVAKKFFKVMARSDLACDAPQTNGLNALKNFLMDLDGYIGVYSINGGNEKLIDNLVAQLEAEVKLNHRVLKIGKIEDERYRLDMINGAGRRSQDFDMVMVCLPHNWLETVEWGNETLRQAMVKHLRHFDRPAHYIRVAALFDKPFWQGKVNGSWFMSDAFGGCCVYIEGTRHDSKGKGVLNWLIAGSDALAYVNAKPDELIDTALKTLPAEFGDARAHFIEGRVIPWISSVNALPGGLPVRDAITNHVPEPKEHPGIVLVGDYMFDSTLNGLLDSSDMASDIVLTQLMRRRYETGIAKRMAAIDKVKPAVVPDPSPKIDRIYFDNYRAAGPYAEVWQNFSDPDYILDMIRMAWGVKGSFKLLVAGSASGQLVGALRERGIDAWGVENNKYIHGQTPKALRKFNKLGSVVDLPFAKQSFDFIFETCLCHVAPSRVKTAINELHRVARRGVYFGSVTSDLTSEVCDRHDLLRGVTKLATWWEWSELFFNADFDLTLEHRDVLDKLWQRTLKAGKGPLSWYEDAESLRCCFYDRLKPSA